jgi:transposase
LVPLDRAQTRWDVVDLEALIASDHPARTIWELAGRFDLSRFEEGILTREGAAGRPCWPARLLLSIWIYGYWQGVASARALERMMQHEPGLRWLAADQIVNHHTLADFRVGHKEALEDVLAQFLVLLEAANIVDVNTLLQDGTKVRTVAGKGSFHRRQTLEGRLHQAREAVQRLDRAAAENAGEAQDARREAARRRAAREALERAEAALAKLAIRQGTPCPAQADEVRVSVSEAEARRMKQPDGGWAPSYNVQVLTEAKSRIVVGVRVTEAANDSGELLPGLQTAKESGARLPSKMVADSGYATRENVEGCSGLGVELIAPWTEDGARERGACRRNGITEEFQPSVFRAGQDGKCLICPAGKRLEVTGANQHHGVEREIFQARAEDCGGCAFHVSCCGKRGGARRMERVVESGAMQEYLARMKRPEIQALYKKRSEVAEFPHLWMKSVKKWRRFSVRGLTKAGMEALWAALAYNAAQWARLRKLGNPEAAAA